MDRTPRSPTQRIPSTLLVLPGLIQDGKTTPAALCQIVRDRPVPGGRQDERITRLCVSLDLRRSQNTKSPQVYRLGALLSNLRYIGSDAVILTL
jgi:hypothetical protein